MYIGERRQIIAHLYKYHNALDQVPNYCTQCHFWQQEKLTAHAKGYSKHVGAAKPFKKSRVHKKKLLRTNPNLAHLTEGVHYIRLSRRESSDTGCRSIQAGHLYLCIFWAKYHLSLPDSTPKIAAIAHASKAELQETALPLKNNTFKDLFIKDFIFHDPHLKSDAGYSTGSSGRPPGSVS